MRAPDKMPGTDGATHSVPGVTALFVERVWAQQPVVKPWLNSAPLFLTIFTSRPHGKARNTVPLINGAAGTMNVAWT